VRKLGFFVVVCSMCSAPQPPSRPVAPPPPAGSATSRTGPRLDASAPADGGAPTDAGVTTDAVVALAPSPAAHFPTGSCFGDAPPQTLAPDPRPKDIFATGTSVLWQSGGLVHVMGADGGSHVVPLGSDIMWVKAADAREIFAADHHLNLVAIDLASGQRRVAIPSGAFDVDARGLQMSSTITLFGAYYALDGDSIYVAWHGDQGMYNMMTGSTALKNLKGPHEIGRLSRARRDGSAAPEHLGVGPDGRFVIHDDFAYYGTRWQGLKRRRLAPGPHTEMVWRAPDVSDVWVLDARGPDLFFAYMASGYPHFAVAIASLSFASTADAGLMEPQVYVTSAPLAVRDGILAGHCVYGADSHGVVRVDLADGSVKSIYEGHIVAGDATASQSRVLAVDAAHLYYADYGGDRVVRWSR
jgi:hypothetical protein